MTTKELHSIRLLGCCVFPPASPQKRFVRQIKFTLPEVELSPAQNKYLLSLAWSYRKQIGVNQLSAVEITEADKWVKP